jgi:geranylgeranyl pyrophosphate synthase
MTPLRTSIPLSGHRARIAQYLRGIGFSFGSVAGRIIQERLSEDGTRDPVRPSLVLWACAACGGDLSDALPVAAAFDLFDRFTLLHDELIGGAPSAQADWGVGQSLNAGDALCALAFHTLARDVRNPTRRLEAARLVGRAVLVAIEGATGDRSGPAALTGAAMHSGAVVAGAPQSTAVAFAEAGRLLATAQAEPEAGRALGHAWEALLAINKHVAGGDAAAFEEVVRYVAQRAA